MLSDTLTVSAHGPVDASRVWALLASPACWPAWAPQMRHVDDLDATDGAPGRVRKGQRLRISTIVPRLAVDVRIVDVDEPTSWQMEATLPIGAVRSAHTVTAADGGTVVTVTLRWLGPRVAGPAVLLPYRPVALFALHRLLRLAGSEAQGAAVNLWRMCGQDPAG